MLGVDGDIRLRLLQGDADFTLEGALVDGGAGKADDGRLPGVGGVGDEGDIRDVGPPGGGTDVVGPGGAHARARILAGGVAQVEGTLICGNGQARDGGQGVAVPLDHLLTLLVDQLLQGGELQRLAGAGGGGDGFRLVGRHLHRQARRIGRAAHHDRDGDGGASLLHAVNQEGALLPRGHDAHGVLLVGGGGDGGVAVPRRAGGVRRAAIEQVVRALLDGG